MVGHWARLLADTVTAAIERLSGAGHDERDHRPHSDLDELAEVYVAGADLMGKALDLPRPEAMHILLLACDDPEATPLAYGLPQPRRAQVAQVEAWLVWMTVTYRTVPDGNASRSVEVVHRTAGNPLARNSTEKVPWERMPRRVRERLTSSGLATVRYQLYPPNQAPEEG